MIASERFSIIAQTVNERKFISTKELAKSLNVTETTIRRDCEELEKQGLLIRVHGGAKSIKQKSILSKENEKRMSERVNSIEKELVAKKAASYVKDGDCIFLDGGTSIVPMLKYLKDKKIKVVTHSNLIVNECADDSSIELFTIGGKYIPEYNMSVGPITINDLQKFNFDLAFLSCAGLDLERKLVYTVEMDTMNVKQVAMYISEKNFLLVDSSKVYVKGLCSFINSDDFDAIICNNDTSLRQEELLDNMIIAE